MKLEAVDLRESELTEKWVQEQIAADPSLENPAASISRVQSDLEYRILGSTAVVTGYTVTRRARGSSTRFSWMRTYAEVDGRCLLLGNHTMALPDRS